MSKRMGFVLIGLMMGIGMQQGRAETAVTLPAGAGEHFTVQDSVTNPLMRTDAGAVLTGTNVALGTMGSTLTLQASNQVLASIYHGAAGVGMVMGSNTVSSSLTSIVIGSGHYMYNSAYSALLGGRDNRMTYGMTASGNSSPYHSVILGGTENVISGAQHSAILSGSNNKITNAAIFATVLGGFGNKVTANYATTVGGQYNYAEGSNSLAAGYYARASHNGSFAWGDSSSTTAASTERENEMVIRAANGMRLTSALGTNALPDKGARFSDNNIVAWGRVIKDDGLSPNEHFGTYSVTNTAQGTYVVTLDRSMTSAFNLIPMAIVEMDAGMMPTNAARARNIYIDQTTGTTNFTVYITDGNHSLTNNDFLFMVTGR